MSFGDLEASRVPRCAYALRRSRPCPLAPPPVSPRAPSTRARGRESFQWTAHPDLNSLNGRRARGRGGSRRSPWTTELPGKPASTVGYPSEGLGQAGAGCGSRWSGARRRKGREPPGRGDPRRRPTPGPGSATAGPARSRDPRTTPGPCGTTGPLSATTRRTCYGHSAWGSLGPGWARAHEGVCKTSVTQRAD